jgi:hypothetical protein
MGSRRSVLGTAVALVVGGAVLVAWMIRPVRQAGPCAVVNGPVMLPPLHEASGLAVSRRTPGLLWSHNDSGSAAVLFALDASGTVRGRVRVPIRTRDWEDVSAGRCGGSNCLYIADIGDNRSARPHIQIYRVPEPAPEDSETGALEEFSAVYTDGPHNAEALFVSGSDLFIVTRDRTGGVYRASLSATGRRELRFERVAQLGLAAVTDAEASRDETSVVVRTSHEAVFYRIADLIHGRPEPSLRINIDGLKEPQGEGVALDGPMLYLISEGRPWNRAGRLLALRCDF